MIIVNPGSRIKSARISKRMTLNEVAKLTNTTRQTLSRYETGIIQNIPSDKIEALADILDVTPAYIMGWKEVDNTPNPKLTILYKRSRALSDKQLDIVNSIVNEMVSEDE